MENDNPYSGLPMIGGIPFASLEQREKLIYEQQQEPSIINDPPASVLQPVAPFVLKEKYAAWQVDVREAVYSGRLIQFPPDDLEIAYEIAKCSYDFHMQEVSRARATMREINDKISRHPETRLSD